MPPRAPRGARAGRPLRLATHNVRGFQAHLLEMAQLWVSLNLDVVFVQETKVGFFTAVQVQRELNVACDAAEQGHAGYEVIWALNTQQGARSAGVAICIRKQLLRSGHLAIDHDHVVKAADGRLLTVPVTWGGHSLVLTCTYLPSGDSVGQQSYLMQNVPGMLHSTKSVLWGGDWNFVEDTGLDRLHVPRRGGGQSDDPHAGLGHIPPAARVLRDLAPDMVDVYRTLHPTTRLFTFHARGAASRLDRWYAPSGLQQYIRQCFASTTTTSDHRPVVVDLVARTPHVHGPGLRRVRLQSFWADDSARDTFQEFLTQECSAAPQGQDDAAAASLLQWWPTFKSRVLLRCWELGNDVKKQARLHGAAQQAPAAADLTAAFEAVERSAHPAATSAALDAVLQARQAWCAQVTSERRSVAWQRRKDWIHQGERPSPGITHALESHQPYAPSYITALQSPATGRLVSEGRPLANLVGHFWANMCTEPDVHQDAIDQVLNAVRNAGLQLSQEEADVVGRADVTEAEVRRALKHSAPGKAPGLDGLPVDLYRKCADSFAPLLARVYSAMAQLGQVPDTLLDGVVSTIYKTGSRVQPGNYRPITLLNTDYRVLAKILAYRLRDVQHKLIQREQTAFMPGRHIGENVMLNQLLPSAVGPGSTAVTVFQDIYKAYDTISRPFLFAVLEAAGLGGGFLRWVKLLLTHTNACAMVNGYCSALLPYTAGVRQGCPLAPQLYLFVAQALLCHLTAHNFGVVVGGRRITACQFADDTQVYLRGVEEIPRFLQAMQVFKQASGQGLNLLKTLVLPIGRAARKALWQAYFEQQAISVQPQRGSRGGTSQALPAQNQRVQDAVDTQLAQHPTSVPPNATVHGLHVVENAKALGIDFYADGHCSVDWEARITKVLGVLGYLSRLPLSVFGRAFASAGYGVSKLLYCAEFVGMPPATQLQRLTSAMAKLVDRKLAPDASGRHFAGVSKDLLLGHPKLGGFGMFPWQQHIQARHALWAIRLIHGCETTPWIHVARTILVPHATCTCPAWRSLSIALCPPPANCGPTGRFLPAPLQRLARAMQALPAWQDVSPAPLTLGPWCASAPLWCNPFLLQQDGARPDVPRHGLEREFADFAEFSALSTVQHVVTACAEIQQVASQERYEQVWSFWLRRHAAFADREYTVQRLGELLQAIPVSWRQAAAARPPTSSLASSQSPVPDPVEEWEQLLARLGWSDLPGGTKKGMAQLRVKHLSHVLIAPQRHMRDVKHQTFLDLACQGLPAEDHAELDELRRLFRDLWKLKWDNDRKELFWRLAVDGIPTAARMHLVGESCACGRAVAPGRDHHFWDCPVATAVLTVVRSALALPQDCPLRRDHVWLSRPPHATIHDGVWMVTCQAALMAMNTGRKLLSKWSLPSAANPHAATIPLPPTRLLAASRVAVAAFWDRLQDFIAIEAVPSDWLSEVSATHAFMKVVGSANGQLSLVLNRV